MNRAPSLLVVSIALAGCHALLDLDRFAPAEGAGGAGGSGGAGAGGGGGIDCTNGCLRSVQRFGGAADEEGRALLRTLVQGDAHVTLVGHYQSTFDFLGTQIVNESGIDLFVSRTSPDLSVIDWTDSYASPANENAQAIAYDGDSTYLCGGFAGTLNIKPLTPLSATATDAGFVVKLGSNGVPIWAYPIQSSDKARCNAVAVDDAGVYIAGTFEGQLTVGASMETSVGASDGWLMKLEKGDGDPIWYQTFGSPSSESVNTLAVRDDVLYLGARFNGAVGDFFGATDLSVDTMTNQNDSVVAALDISGTGPVLNWKQTFSGSGQQSIEQLVVDASGRAHVVGSFNDRLIVAGGPPEFATDGDGFYVRLSASGNPTLVVPLTSQSDCAAHAVAVDGSTGEVAIGMSIGLDLTVGGVGRTRTAESGADAGVVRLDENGALVGIHWLGVAGHHEICWGVAFADDGDIVATGSLGPNAKVDGVAVDAGGDPNSLDLFIARFQRGM